MSAKFNSPIERLGHASGITGWGWLFIGLVIIGVLIAGWFGYFYWQNNLLSGNKQLLDNSAGRQEMLVYVKSIEQQEGKYYATIDPIEWLTGSQAEQQAQADGVCQASSTSCLTHGFYLRNTTTTTSMVLLNQQAEIMMQSLSSSSSTPRWDEPISFERWQGLFSESNSRWYEVPFILSVSDNEVLNIREQYLP